MTSFFKYIQVALMLVLLMGFDQGAPTFKRLSAQSEWTLTSSIKPDFEIFHTQGMVKIGESFFISAVEVLEPTQTYANSDNLWDQSLTRTAGKGRGWLFKMDARGKLLDKVELTNGDAYHPGGIDFDGEHIWVPVAEYRPNSASDIYRVDPSTMKATLSFHVSDHIGTIVYNPAQDTFHGASWGSRRMYRWTVKQEANGKGEVEQEAWKPNPIHYIDYQDCHYQKTSRMLCGGVKNYQSADGELSLGGIDLIDIESAVPVTLHTVPINIYWNKTTAITNNPFWMEKTDEGLRFYFLPDQGGIAELLTYDFVQ